MKGGAWNESEYRFTMGDYASPWNRDLSHGFRCVRYLSDDLLWLNPGSVSYRRPDDPDLSTHYVTITDGRISLHRLPYDVTPLQRYVRGVRLRRRETQRARRFFGIDGENG